MNPFSAESLGIGTDSDLENDTPAFGGTLEASTEPAADNPFSSKNLGMTGQAQLEIYSGFLANREVSPDTYAGARRIAKDLGVPVLLGERDPEYVRSQHVVTKARQLLDQYPRLEAFLKDPDKQKLVHDDLVGLQRIGYLIDNLRAEEKATNIFETIQQLPEAIDVMFSKMGANYGLTLVETGIADAFARQYAAENAPGMAMAKTVLSAIGQEKAAEQIIIDPDRYRIDPQGELAKKFAEKSAKYAAEFNYIQERATTGSFASDAIFMGGTALAAMAPAIGASLLTGSPAVGLTLMASQAGVDRYAQARERGWSVEAAAAEAVFFGLVEAITEKLPLDAILARKAVDSGALSSVLKAMGLEGLEETLVSLIEMGYDRGVVGEEDAFDGAMQKLALAFTVGAGVGGTLRGSVMGLQAGLQAILPDPRASVYEEAVKQLHAEVASVKTTARAPEVMKEALSAMSEDAEVYVNADEMLELQQSGALTMAELEEAGAPGEFIQQLQLGGDVKISVADLLTLSPKVFEAIAPSVRRDVNSDTAREAALKLEERDQTVARLLSDMQAKIDADSAARPVYTTVFEQLSATGRYTDAQLDNMSTFVAERYEARAANTTKTAEELFLQDNVRIRAGRARVQPTGTLEQTVFHGTPYRFAPEPGFPHGRPRLDKMGSGEGAQMYGRGFYSAEAESLGLQYRDAVSGDRRVYELDGQQMPISIDPEKLAQDFNVTEGEAPELAEIIDTLRNQPVGADLSLDGVIKKLTSELDSLSESTDEISALLKGSYERSLALANKYKDRIKVSAGTLYKLDLPDADAANLLDYDAPISSQPKVVQDAITKLGFMPDNPDKMMGGDIWYRMRQQLGEQAAVDAMREAGVPGLRYKDARSRGKDDGTRNFVVWDQDVLDRMALLERNGEALDAISEASQGAVDAGTFLFQEGLTAEEKRQTKQDERVADKNSHGLMPYLRDYSDAEPRRDKKQALGQTTTNNNARKQLAQVDEILALNPDAHTSVEAWLQMMADAYGVQDVPIAPYRFIEEINGQGSIDNLARLTPGQIADADHGFENAAAFREAYTSGKLSVETTAKLFLWSFLSRGVSPYTQEGLFIDAFPGIDPWIAQAAAGNLDVEAFAEWAKTVAPKGRGQPGAGATHNLNAFGRDFLVKMSQDVGDGTGRSRLQYIHDLMADPNSTGQQVRREFAAVGEGVGIDNKVVSFTLLVAGFDDVLVLDRVQFRQMYNDGRFDGVNLYDGFKTEDGKAVTGSGLAKQGDGARGILIYEAMERAVSARIDEIYTALGREGQGSVGRYHWETWVADGQQEASHGSLGAILPAALGDKTAIHKVAAKQGEYGSYAYGARYGVDGSGVGYFTYPTPSGTVWLFTVDQFVEFQQEVKKAGNGVVPTKFKVTEAGNAPWYNNEAVNVEALDQLAERVGSGKAGDGAGTLFQDGADQLISDRLPAGAALAQQQEGVTARGSFQQERDTYGNLENIITLMENADLSTFLHEGGHFWLFQMKQDLDSDYLTEEGRARLQKQFDTAVNWFSENSRQAWADIQRMAKAARKTANSNPDDADAQRRAERLEAAVSRAKLGGGAIYMEDVARNFMNGTIENGTDLEVAYHELWARGVEAYLGEGKAPSAALRNAFASFSAWMTGIYKNLRRLNVQLDDDIRGVFDRLVATEEAIAEEVQRDAYKIPDEVRDMANEKELAELQRLAKEAEFEAQQRLQSVVAEEIASMNREEYKAAKAEAEERISAEVYAEPKYAAVELSRRGRLPDGTQLTTSDGKPAKLRMLRDEFVAVFGVDAARAMPRGMFTNKAEDATGIAEFAMLAGFDSQDSMVAELTKPMPQARDLIRQRTNEYMDAQFSELLDPAMAAEKASEIVLSDKQIELAELQARILKRMARPVLLTAAQRRAIEEGAPPAAVDRERVETARALATGAEPVPEQLDLAAAEAQRAGNIPQRRAQNAARRQTISLLRSLDMAAIKQAAAEYVNRAAVKDLTPQRYIAAAERLSRKASKAIASRDYEEAFALLEQKALNLAIAKQARDAQKKVDSIVSRQNRLAKRSDKKLAASYRLQIFNVARALMDAAGIVSYPVDSLVAVVDAASAEYAKDAPEYASLVGRAQNVATTLEPYKGQYRNMPYSEFLSAVQEIQSIVTEARAAQSMLIEGQRVEHEIIVNEMSAQTADRAPEGEPLGRGTPEQREYISALGTLKAALTRVESWARALDGGRADGPFNTYIVKPVFTALTEYYANRTAPIQKLVEALRPIAGSLKASGKIAAPELDNYVFQNKAELLHAILHTGNESNKQKLLRGGQVDVNTRLKYQWTPTTEASDTLDTSQWDAFIRRMYAEGVITKADMDAVQAIWDIFEETKGAAQKAHFRMHGFYFTEIEPSPVQTPFGTYRGGYAPAITDKMMDVAGGARIDAENLASQQNASMFPGAENGFTKSRVEAFAEPLELDLLRIPGHFDRVMKYAYLGPTIRDVARLVTSRDFRSMINRFSPNAVDQLIVPWLQRTVSQTVTTRGPGQRFTSVLSTISNRIGMQTMAGNIVNAAQQITGLSSAAVILPPRLLMKHLASFKQGGVGVRTFISQHSAYMDVRFRNGVSDMLENVDNILRDTTVLAKTQAYAQRYAYFAQQAVQNLVDPVVWMAAFDHAHDIGVWQSAYDANQRLGEAEATKKADAAAAYYADSIVRQTQAPMGAAEVSRIETGTPLWRIFVKFYSYFNAMLNLNAAEFDITKRQIGYKGKAGKFFYLYMMGVFVPAVVAEGISMAARGEFDTEDDDDLAVALAELFLLSQIKYVAGFAPGGSAAVNRIIGQFTDVPYDDRLSFSPVLGIFDQAISGTANLVEDVVTAVVEGEPARDASKIIRDGLNAIALIFGLPTNWFSKPVQFLQKIEEGKEDPEGVADYVKGFTTGRSQPPKQ